MSPLDSLETTKDTKETKKRATKRRKKRGEKKGEKRGKLETARRMLSDDMPIDRIIKYTGLTEEEIKGLIN